MAITGVLGTRLFVGGVALVNIDAAASTLADFTALSTTVEVGLIENLGEFGRVYQLVPFQSIATGRTYKLRGGFDDGAMQLTVGQDLTDAGQALLYQYGTTSDQATYPFRVLLNGADPTVEEYFFGAKVMSFKTVLGPVNSVLKATIDLQINTPIYVGP